MQPQAPHRARRDLLATLRLTRWLVPAMMAALGLGYSITEFFWPEMRHQADLHLAVSALLLGLAGPLLAWLTLSWAWRAAQAHAAAAEQLRRRSQELLALNTFALDTAGSLDLDRILAVAIQEAARTLSADSGRVYLRGPQAGDFELRAWHGLRPQVREAEPTVIPGRCLCGRALAGGPPLLSGDIRVDPHFAGSTCLEAGFRSVACVPLHGSQRLLGVLQLAAAQPRHFEAGQREFLSALAQPLSIAIENAWLYAQVRSFSASLEQKVSDRTQTLLATQTVLAEKTALLQRALERLHHLQEDERARIAQDLHDGVVQLISGALLETEAARETVASRPDVARARLEDVQTLLAKIEAETRRAIFDLHPAALDTHGLASALRHLAAGYRQHSGLPCSLRLRGASLRLPAELETVAYRVVQEALHNAATHARASHLQLSVDLQPRGLRAEVCDDGAGFDLQEALAEKDHLGLSGMIERAQHAGGRVLIDTAPGRGTTVSLFLPVAGPPD